MKTEEMRRERITWLSFEFAEAMERCERSEMDMRQLATHASHLTSQQEIDELQDELLQHAYWAMQHAYQRPACWAPKSEEIAYLRRCLRDEDQFDPSRIEFSFEDHHS